MATAPLRGRDSELRVLAQSAGSVANGVGGIVLVEGPAGIGKTRLLADAAIRASQAGVAMVAASGAAPPLGPLAPLLAALHGSDPPILDDRDLDSLSGPADRRFWIIERLRAILVERSRSHPLLISVDDLQAADTVTLLAIRTLAPPLAAGPILWWLGRRLAPSSAAMDTLVNVLTAAGAVRLILPPLSTLAAATLTNDILGAPPDPVLRQLVEKSGGNPFLVVELLRALSEEDALAVDSASARLVVGGSPDQLYRRLLGRLGPLSGQTVQMLEVASTLGASFEVGQVAAVLGRPVAALLPSIQEAMRTEVLVEEGVRLAFRHELIREATYNALPAAVRRALHREVAAAVLAGGGSTVDAAAHMSVAADVGDAAVVAALERAADELAPSTPAAAADLRLRGLALMLPADAARPRHLAAAIDLLGWAGRMHEAEALAAAALAAVVGTELEAACRLQLAGVLTIEGQLTDALDQIQLGLGVPAGADATRAALRAAEAQSRAFTSEVEHAVRAGQDAVALGEATGNDWAVCKALTAMGEAELVPGRLAMALDLGDRAVEVAAAGSMAVRRLEPRWWRGRTLMMLDRFAAAAEDFEEAGREADRAGSMWTMPLGYLCRATLLFHQGQLAAAVAEAEAGLACAQELEAWVYAPEALALLAQVAVRRGNLGLAETFVGQAQHLHKRLLGRGFGWLLYPAAQIDAAAGHRRQALDRLTPVYEVLAEHVLELAQDPSVGPDLARLAVDVGDLARARAAAAATERLAHTNPDVGSMVAAAIQARGLVEGDADQLAAAADAFESSPRPFARARACEDAAAACADAGQRGRAVEYLSRALSEHDESGATVAARRVRARLDALGAPARAAAAPKRPAFGWASLTEAELRVARAASSGLTNRAIADLLSVSPHTVESHLRHAFAKLGVRSRVELTRQVLEHDTAHG